VQGADGAAALRSPSATSCVIEPLIPDQPAKAVTPASATKPADNGNNHQHKKHKKKDEDE
jgi:hypothetical protein